MSSHDQAPDDSRDLARSTYESLVNSLPLCILIKGPDGERLFANQAYLEFRNTSLDQIVGKVDSDLFPDDIAERFTADDRDVLKNGTTLQNVQRTLDGNGNLVWIERVKSPIRKPDGRIAGVQVVFWNVTQRIEAQEQMNFERHLLDTLLSNLPDSIYFKDTDSRFIRISDAMAQKFGFEDVQQVVGKTDADVFSQEHADAARNDELQIIRSGESLVDRVEKETWPNRDNTWCMSTKMPFRDHNGTIIGTFGISRDITDLVKSQDSLQKARDAADNANRAKSQFLANMSHEIRTPMNAIIGMSELLSQTALTHEQKDYVELVRESSTNLLRLLNDILDFSRIEARRLEIDTTKFSVRDLVEKAARTLSIRATEKDLELTCRVAPDVPELVVGDPGRVRQILINLVGNGIKFTSAGEVSIDVHAEQISTESNDCTLSFRVQDTGIGIAPEKQAAVMEPFTQADASTTRRYGGTGLGLTISRELVELMGGHIRMDSEYGKGTSFTFSLPFEIVEETPRARISELLGLRVLIVDDNSTNRRILHEILTAWHCEPIVASSGKDAIEYVRHANQPIDVVLLDYMMPEMDGYEVAEFLRHAYPRESLKMIVLSSASHPEVAARFARLGVERYMTKPVVQSELMDTLVQVVGMPTQSVAEKPAEFAIESRTLSVLVAEDGLANQHVAKGLLGFCGHQCTIACDGREAIQKWQMGQYDLVLMDMHMPEMDGLEATRNIRRIERDQNLIPTPIIALTAAAMKEDAQACLDAGMDDYLCKPISKDELQAKLTQYSDVTRQSKDARLSSSRPEEPAPFFQAIDVQLASQKMAGGIAGLVKLAPIFEKECGDLLSAIREAHGSQQWESLQRSAHTLKGSANLFVAHRLVDASKSLELAARDGELDSIPTLISNLESEVREVTNALRNLPEPP